ncbi:MAG: extracellular solute-binding protein [Pirellulales bacterium]
MNLPLRACTGLRLLIACVLPSISGCWYWSEADCVVYTALDRDFSEPILEDYGREAGADVRGVYDVESTKTVGLVQRIIQEAGTPRCDLFWNNEILHTIRLEKLGLLENYASPVGAQYPAAFRSPNGAWHGFAARARVLLVNTTLVPDGSRPTSIEDLADPRWRGRVAIAKPLFGTTATHAACLFATMGEQPAKDFFRRLKDNDVRILSGNKQVARQVAAGQLAFGLTDTDDAVSEVEAGRSVAIVYPDQVPGRPGTLFIPNTLAIVRGAPHAAAARKLIDHLLSPEVEARLAAGPSAQIPLHPNTTAKARVATPHTIRAMQVDFAAAAERWEAASHFLRQEFSAP